MATHPPVAVVVQNAVGGDEKDKARFRLALHLLFRLAQQGSDGNGCRVLVVQLAQNLKPVQPQRLAHDLAVLPRAAQVAHAALLHAHAGALVVVDADDDRERPVRVDRVDGRALELGRALRPASRRRRRPSWPTPSD